MYERILVPIDNSEPSRAAALVALAIAAGLGSALVGMNVYAARLHRGRFRQLEMFLPQRFQISETMGRQRAIHGGLIQDGLRLIGHSYLDWFEEECRQREIPCQRRLVEGRNHVEILRELRSDGYGLVALGALGLGAVPQSLLGSVCERVLHHSPVDVLIGRLSGPGEPGGRLVVGIDGSSASYHALARALALGRALGAPVEAVAVYDPHYHRVAFQGIARVLPPEAARKFRFEEQTQLHEDIIDRGLALVYRRHLERAQAQAAAQGQELKTALLEGKPFAQLLHYAAARPTFALVVGRSGAHKDKFSPNGSVAANLARLASCHVLVVAAPRARPPDRSGYLNQAAPPP